MDFKLLLHFLTQLSKNNNKDWFDAHKKEYESLRKDWILFVGDAIKAVSSFDGAVADLDPKKCIFRINRDIRFSNDKSPYKNNFGMVLNPGGKGEDFCGYYLHVQPGGCFIAGGAHQPSAPFLASIRQEIDYNLPAFKKIIDAAAFKKEFDALSGEKLVRPPKGYDAENPAIEYLKQKEFVAMRKVSDKEICSPDFMKTFVASSKAMKPLIDFLNTAQNG